MQLKKLKHLFKPSTWIKIENRAKKEGKTPEAIASFILSRGVGLIPRSAVLKAKESK